MIHDVFILGNASLADRNGSMEMGDLRFPSAHDISATTPSKDFDINDFFKFADQIPMPVSVCFDLFFFLYKSLLFFRFLWCQPIVYHLYLCTDPVNQPKYYPNK